MRSVALALVTLSLSAWAHPDHSVDETQNRPAARMQNEVTIRVEGSLRIIDSNGIPDHDTGAFPNRSNPNTITTQQQHFEMPVAPVAAPTPLPGAHMRIGVALNGIVFDPVTAEFWAGNPWWNYEATVGKQRLLGLDNQNAHVQPDGTYHYHGLPTDLVKKLGADRAMVQIGWAADGFPIYGPIAYKEAYNAAGPVAQMKTSYRLKEGMRPAPPQGPGGKYDGTFGIDFEYVAGSGDLDECNGRYGVTPEFPSGTYYYVLTEEFPFIPRLFRAIPNPTFLHQPPGSLAPPRGRHRART